MGEVSGVCRGDRVARRPWFRYKQVPWRSAGESVCIGADDMGISIAGNLIGSRCSDVSSAIYRSCRRQFIVRVVGNLSFVSAMAKTREKKSWRLCTFFPQDPGFRCATSRWSRRWCK